ncbi:MAG: tetratricopeptide repeat protein [Cyclobacteriaceae bacterium]|nr:tetratricopeptide repeat protein [Cyclobacteriaceae bacterium]
MIDSLRQIVALNRHDTLEVKALLGLTNEFLRKDVSQARLYAQQVVRTSSQLNYPYGMCAGYGYMVSMFQSGTQTDSALHYLGQLEKLAKAHAEDFRIPKNYNQTAGLFYKAQGEYQRAMPYFLENLKLATKEDENKAGTLLNIGNTYSQMADYRNAMKYHLQALTIFEKLGNKRGQSFCLHGLATDYYFLKQLSKSEEYLHRSLAMKTDLGDRRGLITTWQGLGNVAKDRNQFETAHQYYLKSLAMAREMKLAGDEIITLHQMGMNYMRKPDPAEARKVFSDGLARARQFGDSTLSTRLKSALMGIDMEEQKKKQTETAYLNNLNTFIVSGDKSGLALEYNRLSEYYALNKDYEKAFEYLKKHEALTDSLEGSAVLVQLRTMEEQFKNDQKEKEIELLKKDQELQKAEISRQRANTTIIVVALISVIVISVLLINRYRVLNKTRRLVELERMRNTIARDLHDDIGSTLSSINIISQMALKDANGSSSNFQRIAQHSSSMMESMSDIVWSINPNNDSPEQVISKMKEFAAEILDPLDIGYTFTGEENLHAVTLDAATRKNLLLIFKEAVNNAAKYSGASIITIHFNKQADTLEVAIQDNGKGFDAEVISSGNGLRNMKARATSLRGKLELKSSAGTGTAISLSIPIT